MAWNKEQVELFEDKFVEALRLQCLPHVRFYYANTRASLIITLRVEGLEDRSFLLIQTGHEGRPRSEWLDEGIFITETNVRDTPWNFRVGWDSDDGRDPREVALYISGLMITNLNLWASRRLYFGARTQELVNWKTEGF